MIVLDTDVLIDFLKGDKPTVALLTRLELHGEELATTCISTAELHRGGEDARLPELLDRLVELPFDRGAARRYGLLMHGLDRAGRPLPALDGLVAAVALEHGGRIVSRNRKHYGRVAGLELLAPR